MGCQYCHLRASPMALAAAASPTPLQLLAFYASTAYYRNAVVPVVKSPSSSEVDTEEYRSYDPSRNRVRKPVYDKNDGWRCEECNIADTPQRRRGPSGSKSMCNACGLRWIKKQRRAGHAPPAVPRGPRVKKTATFGTCLQTVLGEEDYEEWVRGVSVGNQQIK